MIGKNLEILFESTEEEGLIKGFSSNYVRVKNQFNDRLTNELCSIKIKGLDKDILYGDIKAIKNSVVLESYSR